MKRFKNIAYVFETSASQDNNIARAVSLAKNNHARLTFLDVVPDQTTWINQLPEGLVSTDLMAAKINERQQALEALVSPHATQLEYDIKILVGTQFLEVIRSVQLNKHDLVIKPAENPEWIDRLFGSDDMHLLRKCPCPVLLMRPQDKTDYECILAAIDFNPADPRIGDKTLNKMIFDLASSLALSDFAELHLVHAWDVPEAGLLRLWADNPDDIEAEIIKSIRTRHTNGMNIMTRMLREQIGDETYKHLSPRIHLPMGSARQVIPALVNEVKADLVVMGTVARTGIPGFIIGNTAEAILDQLQCSVLATKPPGFVSPVLQE